MNAAAPPGKMALPAFLDFRLRPISEELAASGARHVLICAVPAVAHMKMVYPDDMGAAEKAAILRQTAAACLAEADALSKSPGGVIRPI